MSRRPRPAVCLVLALTFLVGVASGCGSDGADAAASGTVEVRNATVDLPLTQQVAAGRLQIVNGTGAEDVLVAVRSDASAEASIHRSELVDGYATMTEVERLPIPARSTVTFEPGGLHVMLEDLTRELAVGDAVELTFTFETAGTQVVTATVTEPGQGTTEEHDHE